MESGKILLSVTVHPIDKLIERKLQWNVFWLILSTTIIHNFNTATRFVSKPRGYSFWPDSLCLLVFVCRMSIMEILQVDGFFLDWAGKSVSIRQELNLLRLWWRRKTLFCQSFLFLPSLSFLPTIVFECHTFISEPIDLNFDKHVRTHTYRWVCVCVYINWYYAEIFSVV